MKPSSGGPSAKLCEAVQKNPGQDVIQLPVGRGAEVDRRGAAPRGRRPGRSQELLARRHEVVGPAAHALGVEHDHLGVVGHHVDEQLHLVDEHRCQ